MRMIAFALTGRGLNDSEAPFLVPALFATKRSSDDVGRNHHETAKYLTIDHLNESLGLIGIGW